MRKCKLCGKGSRMVGHRKLLRGHYNPTNWSRKYPNLQKTKTLEGEKVLACTKCIRNFSKESRIEANKIKREKIAKQKEMEAKARAEKKKAAEAKKAKTSKKKESKPKKEDKPKKEAKKKS